VTQASGERVKVAVVGVGRMGQHHARVLKGLAGAELVAVCDVRPEYAAKIAAQHGCRGFASVEEMLAAGLGVRAATIAVPTVGHLAVAQVLLPAGVDVLIEKPLAPSVADGQAIVALARAHGRLVQVGHTERFNPAYRALQKYDLHPQFVEVTRISPMTFRSIDVGAVLDMMIHDLDIVLHLVGAAVTDVQAVGVSVIGRFEDIANARLGFANGCVANLTASRLALKTERKMRLFSPTAYVSVDYHKKSGAVITRTANEEQLERVRTQVRSGQVADLSQLNYPELVKYEDLQIVEVEPLQAEQESFLHAVRTRCVPEVSGEAGLAAVEVATRIQASIAAHQWHGLPALP
jgi:predicted dehydrogenase